jgi:hypothetical protein
MRKQDADNFHMSPLRGQMQCRRSTFVKAFRVDAMLEKDTHTCCASPVRRQM